MNLVVPATNQEHVRPDERTALDLSIQLVLRHELSAVNAKHAQSAAVVTDKDTTVIDEWCSVRGPGQFNPPDDLARFGVKLPYHYLRSPQRERHPSRQGLRSNRLQRAPAAREAGQADRKQRPSLPD